MSSKRKLVIVLIGLSIVIACQVYFLATYDRFAAEGGLEIEMAFDPKDAIGEYARPALDFDYVMQDAERTYQTKGGDFLTIFAESNKKRTGKPLVKLVNYMNVEELSRDSKDEEILAFLREQITRKIEITAGLFEKRLSRVLQKEVGVMPNPDALKMTVRIPNQQDTLKSEDVELPQVHLGFFECAPFNQVVERWLLACKETEPEEFEEESNGEEVPLVKANGPVRQSLSNTVLWQEFFAYVKDRDKKFVNERIHAEAFQLVFPEDWDFRWGLKSIVDGEEMWQLYVVKIPRDGIPKISNEDIALATFQADAGYGYAAVEIAMTPEGSEKWKEMTSDNIGRCIAMCVNNVVYSAPNVQGIISGGITQISGSDTESLRDIETVLNSKALEIYPISEKQTIIKGEAPLFNEFIQQLLLGVSILTLLFVLGRLFLRAKSAV